MLRRTIPIYASLLAAGLSGSLVVAAWADQPGVCLGVGDLKSHPALTLAEIRSAGRTFFINGAGERKGCPDATAACRAKAFLVTGDRVIAGVSHDGFTCVDFIGAKGTDRAGWLPEGSLAREEPAPIKPDDWRGTWIREEAEIVIKPGRSGRLDLDGNATFGALDPDRVKRGAVNVGELDASVTPDGANLAFAVGAKGTLPVSQGNEFDCKVWMRRLGPFLLVDDNGQCGGLNVSFAGIYRRKSPSTPVK